MTLSNRFLVRQPPQPGRPPHRLVVPAARHVAQLAAAQQQMHHQQQRHHVRRAGAPSRLVPEAAAQPFLQFEAREQALEHHEAGVRREALRLEPDFQRACGFAADFFPDTIHYTAKKGSEP